MRCPTLSKNQAKLRAFAGGAAEAMSNDLANERNG